MKRRGLLSLLIVFLATPPAWAAIGFDAQSQSTIFNTTSTTFSHTSTGSNLTLVCAIGIRDASVTVSDVTYIKGAATVSLAQIRTDGRTSLMYSEIWYMPAPDTGTNTVTVTLSGTPSRAAAGCITLTGTDASPLDANNGATANSTAPGATVTTVADNSWVVVGGAMRTSGGTPELPITINTGTQRWQFSGNNQLAALGGDTNAAITPAGAATVDWTATAANGWAMSGASFKPSIAGARTRVVMIQ